VGERRWALSMRFQSRECVRKWNRAVGFDVEGTSRSIPPDLRGEPDWREEPPNPHASRGTRILRRAAEVARSRARWRVPTRPRARRRRNWTLPRASIRRSPRRRPRLRNGRRRRPRRKCTRKSGVRRCAPSRADFRLPRRGGARARPPPPRSPRPNPPPAEPSPLTPGILEFAGSAARVSVRRGAAPTPCVACFFFRDSTPSSPSPREQSFTRPLAQEDARLFLLLYVHGARKMAVLSRRAFQKPLEQRSFSCF
jgi:hypothetical protein